MTPVIIDLDFFLKESMFLDTKIVSRCSLCLRLSSSCFRVSSFFGGKLEEKQMYDDFWWKDINIHHNLFCTGNSENAILLFHIFPTFTSSSHAYVIGER